jgi:hypothetical protein
MRSGRILADIGRPRAPHTGPDKSSSQRVGVQIETTNIQREFAYVKPSIEYTTMALLVGSNEQGVSLRSSGESQLHQRAVARC